MVHIMENRIKDFIERIRVVSK